MRKKLNLDFRWDSALQQLESDIENILPKINIKSETATILFNFGATIDAFELVGIFKHNFKVNSFHFEDEKTLQIVNDFFNHKVGHNGIFYSLQCSPYMFENKNHLTYMNGIRVYCPIKYKDIESFRLKWFGNFNKPDNHMYK